MKKPRKSTKAEVNRAADRVDAAGKDRQTPKRGPGRQSTWKAEYPAKVEELCRLGATDLEIATHFRVNVSTFSKWKNDYPQLSEALKSGKALADERVERSLYNRAVGYSYNAVKIFMPAGAKKPVVVPYVEHVPPDVTAQIFWLKNRRKDEWRDVHRHEFGKAGEFDKLSDAELVTELAKTAQLLLTDQSEPEEK